jgi:hypothetical protein
MQHMVFLEVAEKNPESRKEIGWQSMLKIRR